jgi:hypothetical protein
VTCHNQQTNFEMLVALSMHSMPGGAVRTSERLAGSGRIANSEDTDRGW